MSIQAMKQALEALEGLAHDSTGKTGTQMMRDMDNAIIALRAAITEAERQEPENFRERLMENARLSNELGYFFQQPAIPAGWLRAVDEAMVCSHLGVADASDSYEVAKKKLNDLIYWNVEVDRYFAAAPKPENSHD